MVDTTAIPTADNIVFPVGYTQISIITPGDVGVNGVCLYRDHDLDRDGCFYIEFHENDGGVTFLADNKHTTKIKNANHLVHLKGLVKDRVCGAYILVDGEYCLVLVRRPITPNDPSWGRPIPDGSFVI